MLEASQLSRNFYPNEDTQDEDVFNSQNKQVIFDLLRDKWDRLNSLYYIINKEGQKVKFRCNVAQTNLFEEMWFNNLILKDRQRGFTTFIDLYILDEGLFTPNIEGAIIAHREEDAKKIFRRKVKFPYDNLPPLIRDTRPLMTDSKSELAFSNNSIIYVAVSVRSGTLQLLHLSEFGKVCAKFPEKAKEIISGSLEAIAIGGKIWIESTAEGIDGYFHDYCQDAMKTEAQGRPLSKLDYKFFFHGWTEDVTKTLDQAVPLTKADYAYFAKVEERLKIKLKDGQKWWWAAKKALLKTDMSKENPATPEEAFAAAVEGAFYMHEFALLRERGQICDVPHQPGIPVNTYWDLGYDDSMSIWFIQHAGREHHAINYYENRHHGFPFYAKILDDLAKENDWIYGMHVGPHDLGEHELGQGKTRQAECRDLVDPITGQHYSINFTIANKIKAEAEGIEAVRKVLPSCWFDQTNTTAVLKDKKVGLPSLENFKHEFDTKLGRYKDNYAHDWASHGAKAFETMAVFLGGLSNKMESIDRAFGI